MIPTVEAHKTTLVFTNAGIDDIFYRLWNAGLGECDVWYNEGYNFTLNLDVKDVVISKRLVDSPVCLVSGEGLSFEMEKVLNEIPSNKDGVKANKILEFVESK